MIRPRGLRGPACTLPAALGGIGSCAAENTTTVEWYGARNQGGALFQVCIDCVTNEDRANSFLVDAHASVAQTDTVRISA